MGWEIMADNLLYPLVNALADCVKSVASIKNKVPNEALYPINNQYHLGDIYIPIGLRNKKDNVYLRIKDEQAHTFICGQTGSGKSNIVKVILSTIINQRPNVKLWLLDYKRVELSLFQNTKSCEVFEWDEEKISQRLNDLYELVLRRYDELAQKGMTECDSSYESIVCVIEEISLMDKKDMKILRKIMAISRAVHIYVIFTTQRPDNTVIDNVVKSLIGNRICLKTDDKKNSIIALDREGCEELRGKGHGYLRSGGSIIEFQAFYITDEQVKQIVDRHSKTVKVIESDNINNEWWGKL
jgi:S-DNA-T family DNA segregation ATPase FtsK/SpoIIIE